MGGARNLNTGKRNQTYFSWSPVHCLSIVNNEVGLVCKAIHCPGDVTPGDKHVTPGDEHVTPGDKHVSPTHSCSSGEAYLWDVLGEWGLVELQQSHDADTPTCCGLSSNWAVMGTSSGQCIPL